MSTRHGTRARAVPGLALLAGVCAVTVGLSGSPAPAAGAPDSGLTIEVVNAGEYPDDQVWVVARGTPSGTPTPVVVADPERLSRRASFHVDQLRAGQVFVSLGTALDLHPAPSPDTSTTRFDVVELTYPGVANLTAVDMFGIPLDIETFDAAGQAVDSRRWTCSTDRVVDEVRRRVEAAGGDFSRVERRTQSGGFLRLVSPNIVSGLHPSGYPRFDDYVESLRGQLLTVRGRALGTDYHYTGAFSGDPYRIVLHDSGPAALPDLTVSAASLVGNQEPGTNAIYSDNGEYLVGADVHHVGDNDVSAAVYRDLVTGFAYGFWGSPEYGNDSARFEVTSTPGPFEHAQPDAPHYNVWAAALFDLTDAYGFPFGDTFNDAPGRNPLIGLPVGGTLRITVRSDVSGPGCSGVAPSPNPTPSPEPPPDPGPTPDPEPTSTPTPSPTPTPTPKPVQRWERHREAERAVRVAGPATVRQHGVRLRPGSRLEFGRVALPGGAFDAVDVRAGSAHAARVSVRLGERRWSIPVAGTPARHRRVVTGPVPPRPRLTVVAVRGQVFVDRVVIRGHIAQRP